MHLEGKNTYMCFHRFYKKLDRRRVIRRWNLLEDYILALGTCVYRKDNGKPFHLILYLMLTQF
jgi:hypothetical protein